MGVRPKQRASSTGEPMHYSVGAVIEVDGKGYLLIDRDMEPFGFAGIAGHIDEGETPEEALVRKVEEEGKLTIVSSSLLYEEEVPWNRCRVGVNSHYWYLYKCEVTGELENNPEASKSVGWYTPDRMRKLTMEPVWKYWFEKLGVLSPANE